MSAPKADSKATMLAITTGFVVLYFIFHKKHDVQWMLTAAAIAGGIGLLSPWLSGWIEKGWLKLAEGLGWFNGRLLLGIVFFLFLTPIALLRTLFGGKAGMAVRNNSGTHWSTRDHTYAPADLEKPW
jgi:hypothetical protein